MYIGFSSGFFFSINIYVDHNYIIQDKYITLRSRSTGW